MSKIVFSYTAKQGADGKFYAVLHADGSTVDTTGGLRNEGAAKNWAENAAITFKQSLLSEPSHGTTRTAYGTFEL